MNDRTTRLIQSRRNISISFGVCIVAVSGIARPIVAISIARTLLYARAIGDSTSTSLLLPTSAQLIAERPGKPARRHSRRNSPPKNNANPQNASAKDRRSCLRIDLVYAIVEVLFAVVLQEREVTLRQVVEFERAAAARALEHGRLEPRREDRRGLEQALLLVVAADAVERSEERRHRAAADDVLHHRRLEDARHRARVELVALDPGLAQELAPRAHAERVHVRDLRGVEHDAPDHRGEQLVEPGRLGEVAAQDDARALALRLDPPLRELREARPRPIVVRRERDADDRLALAGLRPHVGAFDLDRAFARIGVDRDLDELALGDLLADGEPDAIDRQVRA